MDWHDAFDIGDEYYASQWVAWYNICQLWQLFQQNITCKNKALGSLGISMLTCV